MLQLQSISLSACLDRLDLFGAGARDGSPCACVCMSAGATTLPDRESEYKGIAEQDRDRQ
eukprot:scaffold25821_cov135-Isochrysis_galbana.AAC.1